MWQDRDIGAGTEWAKEIDKRLNEAQIILLLVSPDFLASDYCYQTEMTKAIERHEQREAKVIPVILRPSDWKSSPLGKLQTLPKDGKPINSSGWHNQDEALYDVSIGIKNAVKELEIGYLAVHSKLEWPQKANNTSINRKQSHINSSTVNQEVSNSSRQNQKRVLYPANQSDSSANKKLPSRATRSYYDDSEPISNYLLPNNPTRLKANPYESPKFNKIWLNSEIILIVTPAIIAIILFVYIYFNSFLFLFLGLFIIFMWFIIVGLYLSSRRNN